MSNFTDFSFSMQMRDTIKRIATAVVDEVRPPYRYGVVTEIDYPNRKCSVTMVGDTAPVLVAMGSVQPTEIGQVVRVDGRRGDRFVADVLFPYVAPVDPSVAEAWRVIGATDQPAYQNSHSSYGGGHAVPAFYKDSSGVVHLKGMVASPNTSTMFTLPEGYRPAVSDYFPSISQDTPGLLTVGATGNVARNIPNTGSYWISLDGIKFVAQADRDEKDEAFWPMFSSYSGWSVSAGTGATMNAVWKRDDGWCVVHRGGFNNGTGRVARLPAEVMPTDSQLFYALGWSASPGVAASRVDLNPYDAGLVHLYGPTDIRFSGRAWFAKPFSTIQWTRVGTYLNSWAPYVTWMTGGDSLWRPASYYKDKYGIVHLHGLVKNGTIGDVAIFELPVGFRPAERLLFPAYNNGGLTRLEVRADGTVRPQTVGAGNNGFLSLDSVHFRAEG